MKLREGERFHDVRKGPIEIIAVTEKKVWWKRLIDIGRVSIYHTSRRRVKTFLQEGPDWANRPRWSKESWRYKSESHTSQ